MRLVPFLALWGILFAAMTAALAHVQGFEQARCPEEHARPADLEQAARVQQADGWQPFERLHPPPWRQPRDPRCRGAAVAGSGPGPSD